MNPRPLHCERLGRGLLTRIFSRIFLVGGFRSPQVPSRSLPFPLDEVTQGHARMELFTGRLLKSDGLFAAHNRCDFPQRSVLSLSAAQPGVKASSCDNTQLVKSSMPLMTVSKRMEWNRSKVCCPPGSTAKITGFDEVLRRFSTKMSSAFQRCHRVAVTVRHKEWGRIGSDVSERRRGYA